MCVGQTCRIEGAGCISTIAEGGQGYRAVVVVAARSFVCCEGRLSGNDMVVGLCAVGHG